MKQKAKKWMVVVTDDQYEWVKEIAEKSAISGAGVLRALISQAMNQKSETFRRNLVMAQKQAEIEKLEEELRHKQTLIAERKKELQLVQPSGRETVAA